MVTQLDEAKAALLDEAELVSVRSVRRVPITTTVSSLSSATVAAAGDGAVCAWSAPAKVSDAIAAVVVRRIVFVM